MVFDDLTRKAIGEVEALSKSVVSDLDESAGGIGWWSGYGLQAETMAGLSDYLIDAIRGVGRALGMADFTLHDYAQERESADSKMRTRMKNNRGDFLARGTDKPADEASRLHLQSCVYSFLNLGCSVLDTLAGTVIGIAALKLPLVKADLAKFTPFSKAPEYPSAQRIRNTLHPHAEAQAFQLGLIRSFRTSVMDAGPEGWYVWLDHKRNQLAHRGPRLQISAFVPVEPGPRVILLEREPDKTTIQGFQGDKPNVESIYLLEDELTTMKGLLKSLNAATIGTTLAARSAWDQRRENPHLVPQPHSQWHQPKTSGFKGYEPAPELFKNVTAAIINPIDAARLNTARALDGTA
ncbi:hypothetical protein [Arthrobacter celericrescens]|uniref:hypothetical protein n=1 Tax=Arthrobacter celericrescens TaxID=2320851 RepID=UPI0013C44581|nr:hypothetical protein [Arthrobacter celericrescens]